MKKFFLIWMAIFFVHSLSVPSYALEFNAFGDITYGDTTIEDTNATTGEHSAFSLGQLDLWGTQPIDREGRLKAFIELVIESPGGGFIVDLERLWVEYSLIPEIQIRAGRFHTSLGHWNRAHHHGAHMQTSVFRPLFLDFEDGDFGVFPSHMIGVMSVVDYDTPLGRFRNEIQFGNGATILVEDDGTVRGAVEIDPQNTGDAGDGKGLATRLTYFPAFLEGLAFGGSYNLNKVQKNDKRAATKTAGKDQITDFVNQSIVEADLTYIENNVEFIFEYYWINNEDRRQGETKYNRTSTAWYVQAGYTLFDMLTPYYRWEFFDDIDKLDPYFGTAGLNKSTFTYTQSVFGIRFDINNNSSIKLEGRNLTENPDKNTPTQTVEAYSNSYWLQWTFAF